MHRYARYAGIPALAGGALLAWALMLQLQRAPQVTRMQAAPTAQLSVASPHRGAITSLDWSPDGSMLLSTSRDNTARLWQVENGALLRVFTAPQDEVRGIGNILSEAIFVAEGRQVLVAGSNGTRLWNVADGKLVATLDDASDMVHSVTVDARAHIAASTGHGPPAQGARPFLRLHYLTSGARRELDVHDLAGVASLSLNPNGTMLALAGSRIVAHVAGGVRTAPAVRILDLRDGHTLLDVDGLADDTGRVRFDGATRLVYRNGTQTVMHNLVTGQSTVFEGEFGEMTPDGSMLVTRPGTSGTADTRPAMAAELRDTYSGKLLAAASWPGATHERERNSVQAYAFRFDGRQLAIGFLDGKIAVWDRARQMYTSVWPPRPAGARRLQLTDRAGKRAALPTPNGVAIWDLDKGQRIELDLDDEPALVAVSPDGKSVFAASRSHHWMWDAASGTERWSLPAVIGGLSVAAFHPTRDILATASWSVVTFEQASTGATLAPRIAGFTGISAMAFSTNGERLAVGDELGEVRVLPTMEGIALSAIPAPGVNATVTALAFSQDGSRITVAYGNGYNQTLVYDALSGELLRRVGHHAAAINALAVDAQDYLLVTGGEDSTALIRDWQSGADIGRLALSGEVFALSMSADGKRLFSYADYAMRVWNLADPARPTELLVFFELPFRRWAVVDPHGRFDANDLEMGSALHWLMSDAPLRALPPQIFMRDYFEPRLAARLLGCHEQQDRQMNPQPRACDDAFAPLVPVATLNRVQPMLEITRVTPTRTPGVVEVRVAVTVVEDRSQTNGKTVSGAYDLRLFRDGQLVHRWPEQDAPGSDLAAWRRATRIAMPEGLGRIELAFMVRLPSARPVGKMASIELTAYAFNDDRVRSATVRRTVTLSTAPMLRRPTAYVVTVGVNTYQAPSRNLDFAVNDALLMRRALGALEGYDVVGLTLASEAAPGGSTATKANLREVLHRLGGGAARPGTLVGVMGAQQLAAAGPDDLLVLSFSGHGHTEPDGSFYLLASDSGPAVAKTSGNRYPQAALARFISSEELSEWLTPIDAGQLALVLDTCHSGGVVERPGFKPGPMGDHGFGQLAYDKAMLVLAAAQRDDVAIESRRLRQGLLTYALVNNGLAPLEPGSPVLQADLNRNDAVTLTEWLAYGAQRTPTLYTDERSGKLAFEYIGRDPDPGPEWRARMMQRAQTPALFDFTRGRASAVIARRVPEPLPADVIPLPEKIERHWVPYPKNQ